ncbi:MAG: cytochrome [Phenylobacterium sp.]|nr:cytochrome [Phenylobacterium sp.]
MALNKFTAALAFTAGLALAAGGAVAHEGHEGPPPKTAGGKAAWARHDNFKAQGTAFKAILDEFKKDPPDPAVLAANANKLKASSMALPSWFPKGSGPESGVKTDAKAEVWSDAAGFAAAANRFQVEASKFQLLAAAGDVPGMKGEARALGGSCKGCHDSYRVPEKK